jgi:hypothetical protein
MRRGRGCAGVEYNETISMLLLYHCGGDRREVLLEVNACYDRCHPVGRIIPPMIIPPPVYYCDILPRMIIPPHFICDSKRDRHSTRGISRQLRGIMRPPHAWRTHTTYSIHIAWDRARMDPPVCLSGQRPPPRRASALALVADTSAGVRHEPRSLSLLLRALIGDTLPETYWRLLLDADLACMTMCCMCWL